MDPVTIGLLGASALGSIFGGGDEAQKRQSFKGTTADPVVALTDVLDSIKRMGMSIGKTPPVRLSPVQLRTPSPVNIPGVPFQIGGGMGSDVSLANPAFVDPYRLASEIFKPSPNRQDTGAAGSGNGFWDKPGLKNGVLDQFLNDRFNLNDQSKRL